MARPEVTGKALLDSHGSVAPAHRARAPPIGQLAYSVAQFCQAHGISIGHFYALQKKGLGPRVMKVGIRTLISVEEAARWRAERTAESDPPKLTRPEITPVARFEFD